MTSSIVTDNTMHALTVLRAMLNGEPLDTHDVDTSFLLQVEEELTRLADLATEQHYQIIDLRAENDELAGMMSQLIEPALSQLPDFDSSDWLDDGE